jgi:hypothetical protein
MPSNVYFLFDTGAGTVTAMRLLFEDLAGVMVTFIKDLDGGNEDGI